MPIHRTAGGWQWGNHGHVYGSREGAEKQAAAAHAHGYQGGDDTETTAAGVALRTPNGSLLFTRRSPTATDHQGEWAFPAGHVENGEHPLATARRELEEETGINLNETQLTLVDRREGFALFAAELPTEMAPKLNSEHDEYRWAQPEIAPKPLHPWVASAVEMTDEVNEELSNKIAELIRRGMSQKQAVRVANEERRHGGIHHDAYFAQENIGQTRKVTPEGYLVCEGVPIARTGEQLYSGNELPQLETNGAGYIVVERLPEEVFHPDTLASFEGKDVVMNHPADGVDTHSWKELAVGHAQNVRRGDGIQDDLLLADLVIKVPEAIQYINQRLPEVSAGYHADYEQSEPGRATQRNIRGNHIAALVGMSGRAGARVAFKDAAIPPSPSTEDLAMTTKSKVPETFWSKLRSILGSAGVKTADAEAHVASLQKVVTKDDDDDDDDDDDAKYVSRDQLDRAVSDAIDKAFKARDAAAEEARKEREAKDAKDAEEAARKRREMAGGESAEEEATGDTVLEAETVGHVINLGKTWTGGLTGDASASEPVLTAVCARAELLAPGIPKPTADSLRGNKGTALATFMRTAIEKHITADAAQAVHLAPMLMGKRVADLKGNQLLGTFNFAANLARSRNNAAAAQTAARRITGDFAGPKLSIAQLNEQAQAFWANGGKLPPGWKPTVN